MSDAEGTRIATQSDRVGMSRAETFPDAKKIPADPAPGTGRVPVPRTTPGRHRGPLSRKEREAAAEADTGAIPILDLFDDADDDPPSDGRPPSGSRPDRDPAPLPGFRPDRDPGPQAGPPADVRTAQASVAERVHAFLPESLGPDTWDSTAPPTGLAASADPAAPAPARPRSPAGLLLWQDPAQADFGPRRFRLGPARERLETVVRAVLTGFDAVVAGEPERIDDLPEELRGFGHEGAGMACTTLDLLTLSGGRRLRGLLRGPGARHPHLVHLGAGWAYARLRLRPMWGVRSAHPLLRWLAFDGFGFHEGFFAADRTIGRQRTAGLLDRTRRAIFDQGVGRMIWFHECADADGVVSRVAEFPPGRRADLWSGVGMAAAHVGGADASGLARLDAASAGDGFRAHLAQGGALACAIRLLSGSVPDHTAAAAPVLCGVDVDEAASWTDAALLALGDGAHGGDHYQAWRAGVRKSWTRRNRDS
ncbi:DUF1702 family protein [Streptosporangium sandarakinum]|uniref:DUF1702 family protein n=1 Tax=Streptosporangium sandarakinum TaxID=1260955 RepID=UPI00379FED94